MPPAKTTKITMRGHKKRSGNNNSGATDSNSNRKYSSNNNNNKNKRKSKNQKLSTQPVRLVGKESTPQGEAISEPTQQTDHLSL